MLENGYEINNFFTIDKKHLAKRIMQLKVLVTGYVFVLFISNLIILLLQISGVSHKGFCGVFEPIFSNENITFENVTGNDYTMFGEIMIFMHYSFRNFYLDFLLLKFFDNESLNAASCNRSEGFTLSGEDKTVYQH